MHARNCAPHVQLKFNSNREKYGVNLIFLQFRTVVYLMYLSIYLMLILLFQGKTVLLSTTTGAREAAFTSKGNHADIDIALWPINVRN